MFREKTLYRYQEALQWQEGHGLRQIDRVHRTQLISLVIFPHSLYICPESSHTHMYGPMPPAKVWITKDRNFLLWLIWQDGGWGDSLNEHGVSHKIPRIWRDADSGNRQKLGEALRQPRFCKRNCSFGEATVGASPRMHCSPKHLHFVPSLWPLPATPVALSMKHVPRCKVQGCPSPIICLFQGAENGEEINLQSL